MNYSVFNLSFTPVSIPLCVGLCMCYIVWEMGAIELENPFFIIIILSIIKSRNLIRNPSDKKPEALEIKKYHTCIQKYFSI